MIAEIMREKSGEGSLQSKNGEYKLVIGYKVIYQDDVTKEITRRYPKKWFSTGLSTKGNNLRKAKQVKKLAFDNFDPYNPNVPLVALLGEAPEISNQSLDDVNAPTALTLEAKHIDTDKKTEVEDDILFCDYMEQWLHEYRPNVEETTFCGYKLLVETKIVPYFKEKGFYLNQLTARDIHVFYKHMRLYGASTNNRNTLKNRKTSLSAETVRRIHSCIRKALVVATDDELVKTNIVSMLKRPEKPRVEEFQPQFLTLDEANELLRTCKGHALEIPIKLALFYGLRREEVLGLRWSIIDFEGEGQVVINSVRVQCSVDGKYQDFPKNRTKGEASKRSFIIGSDIRELLLKHRQNIDSRRKKLEGSNYSKDLDYVCVNEMGHVFKPGYVTKNFKKLIESNNLRPIRFHDLKQTCSSF